MTVGLQPASSLGATLRRPLALAESEALFEVRGFSTMSSSAKSWLQEIGTLFIRSYNCALIPDDLSDAVRLVEHSDPRLAGFAVEGAAMGAAIGDAVSLGGRKLEQWLAFAESRFTYLAHVGAGWALAKVPWRSRAIVRLLDPVHRWLAYDGLGFADAFFKTRPILAGWRRRLGGYARRSYDHGVGRALWFAFSADAGRAAEWITRMPEERRSDLWSGFGLALAYAGGGAAASVTSVVRPEYRPAFAQGVAFGAEAHGRAGHMPPHCADAVRIVLDRDPEEVIALVREARALVGDEPEGEIPRYEWWRCAVQRRLATP